MKLAIFTKSKNAEGYAKQTELAVYLVANGIRCVAFETADCEKLTADEFSKFIEELKECDAIVVFGGDGTVLRAVSLASAADIPILSVNLGDMGFLAELERSASPESVLQAVKTFGTETRNLIEVSDGKGMKISALNDVVLKAEGATPVYVTAYADGEELDKYRSDGVIVSTPTGSTAYALSAGGPILAPDVDGTVIIPICPHTLHSRPVVLSSNSTVTLALEKPDETANLIVDGKIIKKIYGNEKLTIKKSDLTAKFLRKEVKNFYKRLLLKMNIWGVSQKQEGTWQDPHGN